MLLTIYGRVVSKKNNKAIYRRPDGTPFIVSSREYRRWEKKAVSQLETQLMVLRATTIKRPALVRVSIVVYLAKGQRPLDRDNARAGVFDALERAKVFENDSQISDDPLRFDRDWDDPRVEVEVVEI